MKVALVQMSSSDDPAVNLAEASVMIRDAVAQGAGIVLTPEITNCVSGSREHQRNVLVTEELDPVLTGLCALAEELKIWLLIGSLGVKSGDPDGRFANRSFLIAPDGSVKARYDKIHMFDVDLGPGEKFTESEAYRPGAEAVVAETPLGNIGLSICYDVRFGALYWKLAQAGAQILTVPAAFAVTTGQAHWEVLLRARAIETGCYVLAPAQCGAHRSTTGHRRATWGHSLAISPWGEVLADGGTVPGVTLVDLDLSEVSRARARVPSLTHDREFKLP
jgi:deaminated glutathione amidase